MIFHLILILLGNSLFIFGLKFVTWYNPVVETFHSGPEDFKNTPSSQNRELLWFISFYGKKWFGYEVMKPVTLCPSCMSSVWGSVFYVFAKYNSAISCATIAGTIAVWVVYILALCGLNHIISRWV